MPMNTAAPSPHARPGTTDAVGCPTEGLCGTSFVARIYPDATLAWHHIDEARELLPEVEFRMFRPHEVAAGQAFPSAYRLRAVDPATGRPATDADVTKGAGNAVPPPNARDLMGVVYEAATGETAVAA